MIVNVSIHQRIFQLRVEPSDTVGSLLSQLFLSAKIEQQAEGQQHLFFGGALLDNEHSLVDIGVEDGAHLVFGDPCLQINLTLPRATTSQDDAIADTLEQAMQSSVAAADQPPAVLGIDASAADEVFTSTVAAPLPFLMQKVDPMSRHNIRRAPSLEADILCVVVGRGIYECVRVDSDWTLVAPSEFERLKATGEAFVAEDAGVEFWCLSSADKEVYFERLNVDDMEAAVRAHRTLLSLFSASSSWFSPSVVAALQSLIDADSPSVRAYACAAACSCCAGPEGG